MSHDYIYGNDTDSQDETESYENEIEYNEDLEWINIVSDVHKDMLMYIEDMGIPLCENLTLDSLVDFSERFLS